MLNILQWFLSTHQLAHSCNFCCSQSQCKVLHSTSQGRTTGKKLKSHCDLPLETLKAISCLERMTRNINSIYVTCLHGGGRNTHLKWIDAVFSFISWFSNSNIASSLRINVQIHLWLRKVWIKCDWYAWSVDYKTPITLMMPLQRFTVNISCVYMGLPLI